MTPRLGGRIALITGASRGIGAAVAQRFAQEGAHLVLVARTQGGLEEVDDRVRKAGSRATLVPMDLADASKIDQMAAALFQRFGRLDILVGNAGMLGTLSPMGHIEPKEWARVMDVNLHANWRLIRAMDPLLRESDSGRAMFVTCSMARGVFPYWGAYATSKAGLETMAKTWAGEVTKTQVRVNLVDPGIVATKLRAQAFPGEDQKKLKQPEAVTNLFVELAEPSCKRHGEVVGA
jgi:NAD(P)-dependent dehydrogenase (short-subunit alcohol dehydrogenase family)